VQWLVPDFGKGHQVGRDFFAKPKIGDMVDP